MLARGIVLSGSDLYMNALAPCKYGIPTATLQPSSPSWYAIPNLQKMRIKDHRRLQLMAFFERNAGRSPIIAGLYQEGHL